MCRLEKTHTQKKKQNKKEQDKNAQMVKSL